jgi:glycine cleavage system aminomethyltransferase T
MAKDCSPFRVLRSRVPAAVHVVRPQAAYVWQVRVFSDQGLSLHVAHGGYTGEDGFEVSFAAYEYEVHDEC